MAADQFCLRWNNFQLNIASALDSLKCDEDLVDVTLSCEGQNVKAHKVILSACSPYFRGVFKENPCQHPIVILKDVSYDDISALLSFMYQGEVYITQDRLASFLHTAELLQVRGLAGATNPFKDTPKSCKAKKAVMPPSGQLRHDTPPLSSPPPVLIPQSTSIAHPVSKSPLLPSKDSFSSFSLVQTKLLAALNSSTTLHQSSPVTQSSSYTSASQFHSTVPVDQSSSSYQQSSSNQPQQSVFSSSESGQQFQRSDTEPSNHRSSSPQPPATKRRKAFPRRVSVGGQLSSEETTESQDGERSKSRSGEEQIGCEVVSVGTASVKQEPEDESIFEVDATMEEESNPIPFSNTEEDEVRMDSPSSDSMRRMDFYANVETNLSEDPSQNVKEESLVESNPVLATQSMLVRSLSSAKQTLIVGDASPSRISDGNTATRAIDEGDGVNFKSHNNMEEIFGLPTWPANKPHDTSDLFILSESMNMVNRRFGVAKHRLSSGNQHPTYDGMNNSVANRNNATTTTNSKHSMYQQRKHSWRSRRPVQCPNCQKIITMAYNLKSHLSTCLKRNGIRSKVDIKFSS